MLARLEAQIFNRICHAIELETSQHCHNGCSGRVVTQGASPRAVSVRHGDLRLLRALSQCEYVRRIELGVIYWFAITKPTPRAKDPVAFGS